MNTTQTKQIKKYVAFNPASSDADEWWTADSLKEMEDVLWAAMAADGSIRKLGNGRYVNQCIEIYNTKIHPKVVEVLDK